MLTSGPASTLATERLRRALGLLSCAALLGALVQVAACPGDLTNAAAYADTGVRSSGSGSGGDCTAVVDQLFAQTCSAATCHASSMPAAGIDLQSPDILERLKGVEAPDAGGLLISESPDGSATGSVLYEVLTSDPPGGARMPLNGAPLTASTLACVAAWLQQAGGADASIDAGTGSDAGADATGAGDGGSPPDTGADVGAHDATVIDAGTAHDASDASVHDAAKDSASSDTGAHDKDGAADGAHADSGHD